MLAGEILLPVPLRLAKCAEVSEPRPCPRRTKRDCSGPYGSGYGASTDELLADPSARGLAEAFEAPLGRRRSDASEDQQATGT